jgi:hypothetical protein
MPKQLDAGARIELKSDAFKITVARALTCALPDLQNIIFRFGRNRA